jgi:hypothetical protein
MGPDSIAQKPGSGSRNADLLSDGGKDGLEPWPDVGSDLASTRQARGDQQLPAGNHLRTATSFNFLLWFCKVFGTFECNCFLAYFKGSFYLFNRILNAPRSGFSKVPVQRVFAERA